MPRGILAEEKGAALIGVLLVLMILTLLAGNAFLASLNERDIAANQEASLQAAYAAEAGLQDLLSRYRNRPNDFLDRKSATEMGFPVFDPQNASCSGSPFCLQQLHYDPASPPAYVEGIMVGNEKAKKGLSRFRGVIRCTVLGGDYPLPRVFKMGIVSAGRLTLTDPLQIRADLHASQGYGIHPSSILERLQEERFSVTQSVDPFRPDYRMAEPVPWITEDHFREYRTAALRPGNQMLSGLQVLTLSGDQGGRLLFVDGDLQLQAENLSGIVVVVTGSLTLAGDVQRRPGQDVDAAFIAGGDIFLKPTKEINGLFWTNGAWGTTGSGKIRGAVVCQKDIRQDGGLDFEKEEHISNAFLLPLSPKFAFSRGGWSQM